MYVFIGAQTHTQTHTHIYVYIYIHTNLYIHIIMCIICNVHIALSLSLYVLIYLFLYLYLHIDVLICLSISTCRQLARRASWIQPTPRRISEKPRCAVCRLQRGKRPPMQPTAQHYTYLSSVHLESISRQLATRVRGGLTGTGTALCRRQRGGELSSSEVLVAVGKVPMKPTGSLTKGLSQ